jgi:glycosyltransferase involved in cell wall biosynthesis
MFAPVALFAYKRPDHTQATLEALARNTLASETNLFIFSDGAKSEAERDAVDAVRKLARNAIGFSSVTLIERPANMGLARSVITGVTELLEQHEQIIVLEDDLVTSQHFLAVMNDMLVRYRDDPLAFSVTGHTFPEPFMRIPGDYPYDTYAGHRCSSWSWGTWRDRWQSIDWKMNYFPSFCQDRLAQEAFNRGGDDMTTLLRMQYEGRIDSWAIRFCYAHHTNGKHCIYPIKTLVRNIGLDNTGTHSKPEARFFHLRLDESWRPFKFCPADLIEPRIEKSFYSVFAPPPPSNYQVLKRKVKSAVRLTVHFLWKAARRLKRLIFRPIREVGILFVNTMQKDGGAARAAYRTYLAMKAAYPQAHYLTLVKDDLRSDISGRYRWSIKGLLAARFSSLDRIPMARYPNRLPVTFTPAVWPNPLRIPLARFRPTLVHLHWVASSMLRVEELAQVKVPVVWTLHDTWAFTGGCHYTGECEGFRKQCGTCPQLGSDRPEDLSHSIWQRKSNVYADMNLTVVAPSRWLANEARQSSLFAGRRIEVIPNGLNTEVFKPIDKKAAKAYIGVDPSEPILLFGAQWLTDRRKGGDLLCAALGQIDFPCTLLTFGEGKLPVELGQHISIRALGTLSDEISLALMYSAADAFLCPSREDNLPNTVAEALACGTPCVAFEVNGLPDMIEHRFNGWLAKPFDAADYAEGIKWVLRHPQPEQLRQAARTKALAEYSLPVMTERYARLYKELLEPSTT